VAKVARANNVRVSLAVPLNATTTAANASTYSRLSLDAPFLVEVGVDDFADQYKALFIDQSLVPASLLSTVIANLKSSNPALEFGATIYEDQLTNAYLQDARLPGATRAQFDIIHLFVHYRMDGPNFASYAQQAQQLFPNARIIAGSYAYDRRAYLPCAPGGQPCSTQQELDLFSQTIALQAQLLASQQVDSIEFYPGYFGAEDHWDGWNNPRECAPGDLTNCIANTEIMRRTALAVLGGTLPAVGTPTTGPGAPVQSTLTPTLTGGDTIGETLIGTGMAIAFAPGQPLNGVVATFTDSDVAVLPSDLQPAIDWGDGSTSMGSVAGGSGTFQISDMHAYTDAGTYTVHVWLTNINTQAQGTAQALATVAGDN
jgi:hypothetical protein